LTLGQFGDEKRFLQSDVSHRRFLTVDVLWASPSTVPWTTLFGKLIISMMVMQKTHISQVNLNLLPPLVALRRRRHWASGLCTTV
jgi:hypothetical protein